MSMYDRYEALLKEKGVSTYQVCNATGINQTTISMWKKRGQNDPKKKASLKAEQLVKLAKYFEVPMEYFFE